MSFCVVFIARERARRGDEEESNLLDDVGRENKRLQQQIEEDVRILSEKRKAEEEKKQHEEHLREIQREMELKEVKRRQENLKRLQLEAELCRSRDKLFNYRLGEKTHLDCFQGIQIEDVTQLRIGVCGPSGSGKSSFINTCERALRQTEKGSAPDSTTGQADAISVQEYLPEMFFRLVEIRGLFSNDSVNSVVLKKMFWTPQPVNDREHKADAGEKEIHPFPCLEEKLHGIVFVLKVNDRQLNIQGQHDMWELISDIRHHGNCFSILSVSATNLGLPIRLLGWENIRTIKRFY